MDFSGATILCLGDVMLDRFAYCETERISPEAPVPVLLLKNIRGMLGGAGNVARNIAALGGNAILMGLLGRDPAGAEVEALVRATPGLVDAHVASTRRPTICKTRYVAAHQQIIRVDEESVGQPDEEEEAQLFAAFDRVLAAADAVILSDYGKGGLSPRVVGFAIERARAVGVAVYVDPKSEDFGRYRGATCVTPNLKELALASRMPVGTDAEVIAAVTKLLHDADAAAILAKRSDKGMVLVEASGAVHIEASRAREVYDVTGAGDTVIAVLALAHAGGETLASAMRLANTAAGIVVSKLGTATVELDELMLERSRDVRDKEWHRTKALRGRRNRSPGPPLARARPRRRLHQRVFRHHACRPHRAARRGARRMRSPGGGAQQRRQHPPPQGPQRPVNPLHDRSAVIAAVGSVDAVISFEDDTPIDLIPPAEARCADQGRRLYDCQCRWRRRGPGYWGRVVLVDLVDGRSTSATIIRLRASDRPASAAAG